MERESGSNSKNNRACSSHLVQGRFKEGLSLRLPFAEAAEMNSLEALKWISSISNYATRGGPVVNFEQDSDLTEDDYLVLTGFSIQNFDSLLGHCTAIKNSGNRSKRNALAMFLMHLRLNLSQRVLCLLFGIKSQSVLSETLDSVLCSLEEIFVPTHPGFSHVLRKHLIENHSVHSFDKLLISRVDDEGAPLDEHRLQLIFDGTYVYIQKPSDFELQKLS